jgi:hypothetical protein
MSAGRPVSFACAVKAARPRKAAAQQIPVLMSNFIIFFMGLPPCYAFAKITI